MEHDNKIREELEKLINSEYSSHLISNQIFEVIKKKWQIIKWFIYPLILAFGYLNYNLWGEISKINTIKKDLEAELKSIKKERDSIANYYDDIYNKYVAESNQLKYQLKDQKENIDRVNMYYTLYVDLFKTQLNEVIELKNKTEKNITAYNQLSDTINKRVTDYYSVYTELKSLQESINQRIDSVGNIALLNKTNSAIRYVHAEKSDRYKGEIMSKLDLTFDEYKPSTIVLPGTSDTLTFIFYNATRKGRIKKTIQLDVFRNHERLPISPLEIKEDRGIFTPSAILLPISNDINYLLEPVFIYLPPNIGGALIIPDFVVLKISLEDNIP
ncbi:hypothetical protein [Persicobacter diffluens]|uniref:Uncharacterized protein n=1 Tax=Persicobacter diffluens TaxID=981 RepID=A0AAN4W4D3_9BACT|nr:hypothetical protein PEDI_52060 [Persicobacter diffluens]